MDLWVLMHHLSRGLKILHFSFLSSPSHGERRSTYSKGNNPAGLIIVTATHGVRGDLSNSKRSRYGVREEVRVVHGCSGRIAYAVEEYRLLNGLLSKKRPEQRRTLKDDDGLSNISTIFCYSGK